MATAVSNFSWTAGLHEVGKRTLPNCAWAGSSWAGAGCPQHIARSELRTNIRSLIVPSLALMRLGGGHSTTGSAVTSRRAIPGAGPGPGGTRDHARLRHFP